MEDVVVVICNAPDAAAARAIAARLVDSGAAACVNVLAPCESVYRWQGKVETASEVPMLIKTVSRNYPRVEALIKAEHPYEVPEIIAVPLSAALPAYLEWVRTETAA